jgi:hypothetical protein
MAQETRNTRPDMPAVARAIALAVGVLLIVGSASTFLAVRPLKWQAISLGIGAAGLGADLLGGGIRGRWPVSALFWLVP